EHCALSRCRSGVGFAPDEQEVPPPLRLAGRTTQPAGPHPGRSNSRRNGNTMAAGQDPGNRNVRATAAEAGPITIRKCEGIEELNACVALQKEVWKFDDVDLIPLRMFVVSQKIGGQVIGAFDGAQLVGFAFSIPGSRSGHAYLHSHMLAVRDAYRN